MPTPLKGQEEPAAAFDTDVRARTPTTTTAASNPAPSRLSAEKPFAMSPSPPPAGPGSGPKRSSSRSRSQAQYDDHARRVSRQETHESGRIGASAPAVTTARRKKSGAWWKTRLFAGMVMDVRRRAPFYASDWRDAWDYRVVPATVYMYFAKYVP